MLARAIGPSSESDPDLEDDTESEQEDAPLDEGGDPEASESD